MNRLQANLCLICVTLCWSTEVIIFACIPDDVLPFATSFITSAIAAAILAACFFRRIAAEMKRAGKEILLRCLLLGVLKAAYDIMFLYGLKYFDVSTGAFTFSITVVVLPVVLLTMRKSVDKKTWISVVLVLTGIVFALGGSLAGTQVWGLVIMFIGCTLRALFFVKLNDFAKEHDSITLSVWISVVGAIISFAIWVDPAACDLRRDPVVGDGYRRLVYLRLLHRRLCANAECVCTEARHRRRCDDHLFARDRFFADLERGAARKPDRQGDTVSVSRHRRPVHRDGQSDRDHRFQRDKKGEKPP